VALPNNMSINCVCTKCQWTEAASVRHLVLHETVLMMAQLMSNASLFAAKGINIKQIVKQYYQVIEPTTRE